MSNSRHYRPHATSSYSPRRNNKSSTFTFLRSVSRVASTTATASTVILTAQAAHVAWNTPRLPPPPNSGYDFPIHGLVSMYREEEEDEQEKYVEDGEMLNDSHNNDGDSDEEKKIDRPQSSTTNSSPPPSPIIHSNQEEVNLVIIGDSPVEGIGNATHRQSLSGQTARHFSKITNRPVRYWSFGVCGLTAKGIKDCMLPLLHQVVDIPTGNKGRRHRRRCSNDRKIDAVVVSCGVNNVLWGQSASAFGIELKSLLISIQSSPGCEHAVVLVMGLPDFSRMPFLPWPLSSVVGWRGRALKEEMERVVEEMQLDEDGDDSNEKTNGSKRRRIALATIPEVQDVLGDAQNINTTNHPLLDHLRHDPAQLASLQIQDFFADDGFHPGKHGTILLGNLLSRVYAEEIGISVL
uniref:SGNH hydrolase-type esterase domain-containing protein n=1 Tax=Ditylum brightwellii TaxID=49249 RepID=A0A6V2AR72_9STRA